MIPGRLLIQVNWDNEKECFQALAAETSDFYSLRNDPFLLDSQEQSDGKQHSADGEVPSQSEESQEKGNEVRTIKMESGIFHVFLLQARADCIPELYKHSPWQWTVEHVVFPALKSDFIPQRKMAEDGSILQIADLHDLYKVFERC